MGKVEKSLGQAQSMSPPLVQLLRSMIRKGGGRLPFAEFIKTALYDPSLGYYGREHVFGRDGDYQTAPRVHPLFGWTVAEKVVSEWERMGEPEDFTILELGVGDGKLMEALVERLSTVCAAAEGWSILLRDLFPRKNLLRSHEGRMRVEWIASLEDVEPFTGVVIANEFLDALPFHSLVFHGGSWKERYVRTAEHGSGFSTEIGPLSLPSLFEGLPTSQLEGVTVEVRSQLSQLFGDLKRIVRKGSVIFFDYGDEMEALMTRYPDGTIETFRRHALGVDLLEDPGQRDITAWVDFTAVVREAGRHGFTVDEFLPQAEALHEWGMEKIVEGLSSGDPVKGVKARLAMKTFLFGYSHHRVLSLRMARRDRDARLSSRIR